MISDAIDLTAVFASQGPLSQHLPGYQPRPQQLMLAQAIERVIKKPATLVAEAPTGVGKTLAYLVPSILSGKKVVISTGTKALQEQLFCRDLPKVLVALGVSIRVAMLKGRQNYLCHYKLHSEDMRHGFANKKIRDDFFKVKAHLNQYQHGDLTEHAIIAENSPAWSHMTSTTDSCLGQSCEFFNKCFVAKARREAQRASLTVINHHLFFADALLKEEGFGEILPEAEVVIIDEAHQFPEIGRQFLGKRLSTRQLGLLASDMKTLHLLHQQDDVSLQSLYQALQAWLLDWQQLAVLKPLVRADWQTLTRNDGVVSQCQALLELSRRITQHLASIGDRSPEAQNLWQRSQAIHQFCQMFFGEQGEGSVQWLESSSIGSIWHQSPVDVADDFRAMVNPKTSYCFTSATLTVSAKFDYFTKQLDLADPECLSLDTPYDFAQQARLFCPRYLADPSDERYVTQLVDAVLPIIQRLSGRTFLLFTSFKALRVAYDYLVSQVGKTLTLLAQGEQHKRSLLDAFISGKQSVLLGCQSFWEGVDVPGDALSCVVIDKLPFEPPFDPVAKARANRLRQQGIDPFVSQQLPAAVITLKQGLGRLIRQIDDKGLLVVGDPRLRARAYGKQFLESLPPLKLIRDQNTVLEWLDEEVISE